MVVSLLQVAIPHLNWGLKTRPTSSKWPFEICENVEPELRNRYGSLCSDPKAAAGKSVVSMCVATLPRFYQRVEGSVYLNHMKRLSQSRGEKMPDSSLEEPLPCY